MARKLDPPYSRYMLYGIALLEGDTAAMQQQVDGAAGTPAEAGMLAMQSVAVGLYGPAARREAPALDGRSSWPGGAGSREGAGAYSAGDALWEAAYGNCREARAGGGTDARPRLGAGTP